MLVEVFAEVERALAVACRAVYGDRLRGVVVFGSVGRGTMRPDSDLDVLILAQPLPDGRLARVDEFGEVDVRMGPTLAAAAERGVLTRLSPVLRTPGEVLGGGFLSWDMAEDGRARAPTWPRPEPGAESCPVVAATSAWLRREREFAMYGEVDVVPTEAYRQPDAERASGEALAVYDLVAPDG